MDTLDTAPLYISNFEVLQFLRDEKLEQNEAIRNLRQAWTEKGRALRAANKVLPDIDQAKAFQRLIQPENVCTVQRTVTDWLMQPELPTSEQSATTIQSLTHSLVQFDKNLTKMDILQMINSMPKTLPELYVIVDNLDGKIPNEEKRNQLVALLQSPPDAGQSISIGQEMQAINNQLFLPDHDQDPEPDSMAHLQNVLDEEDEMLVESDEEEEDLLIGTGSRPSASGRADDLDIDEAVDN